MLYIPACHRQAITTSDCAPNRSHTRWPIHLEVILAKNPNTTLLRKARTALRTNEGLVGEFTLADIRKSDPRFATGGEFALVLEPAMKALVQSGTYFLGEVEGSFTGHHIAEEEGEVLMSSRPPTRRRRRTKTTTPKPAEKPSNENQLADRLRKLQNLWRLTDGKPFRTNRAVIPETLRLEAHKVHGFMTHRAEEGWFLIPRRNHYKWLRDPTTVRHVWLMDDMSLIPLLSDSTPTPTIAEEEPPQNPTTTVLRERKLVRTNRPTSAPPTSTTLAELEEAVAAAERENAAAASVQAETAASLEEAKAALSVQQRIEREIEALLSAYEGVDDTVQNQFLERAGLARQNGQDALAS